jgi:hypothetical protein
MQNVFIDDFSTKSITNLTKTVPINIGVGGQQRVFMVARCIGGLQFFDGSSNPITTGTSNILIDFKAGNNFYAKIVNSDLQYGQLVNVQQTVPRDVKIKDFLKWTMQRFNLRIEPLKSNPKVLLVESYNDFYNNTLELDWTSKLDVNSPIEFYPMGELQGRSYIFKYKDDKDIYNEAYQNEFRESYGQETIDIDNEFIRETKTIEIGFSNTPAVGNIYNDLAVPKLYKQANNGNAQPMKCNPRSLYYIGMKGCTPYTFDVNGTQWDRLFYPYAGFVDDPSNPTIDLSFDNPFRLYWTLPAQTFTNNNYYQRFWRKYIEEITDKNSKILKCKLYLNEVDMANFSFRNIVWIVDAWYLVNKIENWNPNERGLCDFEGLKLKDVIIQPQPEITQLGEGTYGGGITNGGLIGGGLIGGGTSGGNPPKDYGGVPIEQNFNNIRTGTGNVVGGGNVIN